MDHARIAEADGLQRLRRNVLGGIVVIVPAAYLPGITQEAYNIPKLVLLMAGVSVAAGLKIAEFGRTRSWSGARALALPASALAGPLLLSWIFTRYKGWAVLGEHSRLEGLVPYLLVIATAIFVADAFRNRARDLARLMTVSGSLVALLALLQGFGIDVAGRPLIAYVAGPMGNSNYLGGFLAIVLPISAGVWLFRAWSPWLGIITTALIATALLMSFSQGAWLAGPAGTTVVAAARAPIGRRAAAMTAVLVPIAAITISLGAVVYSLFEPFGRFSDSGNRTRALWWRSAVSMATDSPIVGHGPNAYAMEAVRYRLPEDAMELPHLVADGPHSVPISLLAGTGIPGTLGFCVVIGWALKKSAVLWRNRRQDLTSAFIGAVPSYLAIAIVNDHLMIEFAFWLAVAGLVTSNGSPATKPPPPRTTRRLLAYGAGAAAMIAGLIWSAIILAADIQAQRGTEAFDARAIEDGRRYFRSAISLRDEYVYRQLYGDYLGITARDEREEGRSLIEEMDAVLSPLESWPKLSIRLVHARWLHEWSVYEPVLDEKALEIYRRAQADDPFNPNLGLFISDIYLQADEPERAADELGATIDLVERYPQFVSRYPDLWANLAIAHLQMAEVDKALGALAQLSDLVGDSAPTSSCRATIAFELLRRIESAEPPPFRVELTLGIQCSRSQLRLVPFIERTA